jgi:peptidylglycine monooxygenase
MSGMPREHLFVALAGQRYRVERPWGAVPQGQGGVTDVACDAAGRVYVQLRSDPYDGGDGPAIVVLEPDGRLRAAWGGETVLDGHMFSVHPDGRVFVVDRDAHEIIIFSAEGKRLGGIGTRHAPGEPFNAPCDVAFAPDGTIYVADGYAASRIHRFSADGTPQGGWGRPGTGPGAFTTPHSVWVLADGRVAVADRENHRVQVFTAEGAHLLDIGDSHKPMDVHGAPDGALYVTDQIPRLSLFCGTSGALLGRCRPVLNGAHGMWRDGTTGILYLAEMNPSRITRLVPVAG